MAIALLSGTHRPGSYTLRVAEYLARRLEAAQQAVHILDFRELPADFLVSDLFGARSAAFAAWIEVLRQCPTWIWVVPEYNGSFPGIAKVFIDALPREVLRKRRAGLVGVSDGRFGNLRGLDQLSAILHYCGMEVLSYRAHLMRIQTHWDTDANRPLDPFAAELESFVKRFLEENRTFVSP